MTCFVLQARVAWRLPWWSLASGFAATRDLAGFQGSAIQVHKALTEQTIVANGALPPGAMPAKDNRQVTLASSNVHTSVANADACLQAIVSGVAQTRPRVLTRLFLFLKHVQALHLS